VTHLPHEWKWLRKNSLPDRQHELSAPRTFCLVVHSFQARTPQGLERNIATAYLTGQWP
jgi:hypothetical protein